MRQPPPGFYVYAICFDQDTFGIFATREAAEEDLRRQIAEGGPAWEDCQVQRWRVKGDPEIAAARPEGIDPNYQPSWRARMYGRCRMDDHNILAYLFADKRGRKFLRELWDVWRISR